MDITDDERTPPPEFMADLIRALAQLHCRSLDLGKRLRSYPESASTTAVDDILHDAEVYSTEMLIAAILTADGQPTTTEDVRGIYLERRPAMITLDGLTAKVVSEPQPEDELGRSSRRWNLVVSGVEAVTV